MRRRLSLAAKPLVLALVFSFHTAWADQPAVTAPDATNDPTEANIALMEGEILQNWQYAQHPFDAEISSKFLDRYLDTLDYSHIYFLQSDIKEFEAYRTNLQVLTMEDRNLAPCWVIFSRFIQRANERISYVTNLLATMKFEFNGHERFVVNRHDLPYPRDAAEEKDFWRQELRCEYLEQVLEAQGIEFAGYLDLATNSSGKVSGLVKFSSDKAHALDFPHFPKTLLAKDGHGLGSVEMSVDGSNATVRLQFQKGANLGKTTNAIYSANGVKLGELRYRRITALTASNVTTFYFPNLPPLPVTNLTEAAAQKLQMATNYAAVIHLDETNMAVVNKNLTNHYAQMLENYKELDNDRVFEMYMNALAHAYDPHSDYMGQREADNFAITMKLSLFGIGAILEKDQVYCKIKELKEGPAKKSGQIKQGDRIVAVAQGGGSKPADSDSTSIQPAPNSDQPVRSTEPVDVIGMPLEKIVGMIRGPKGTEVTLTIIPVDSPDSVRKNVTLVRDEIKLDEQHAKAMLYEEPTTNGTPLRLGVIDLASFYADPEHPDANTTADVSRFIKRLKQAKVDGIILDLRRNGGGYLDEAIKLTGLFDPEAPVVQTKDPSGVTLPENSPEPGPLYDGPLIVLTSVFSASASEILAGALQDYGRALIVGDHATFGKGTVQTPQQLKPLMDSKNLHWKYDPGELKVTIKKFYRPGGVSTQLQGVLSDVALPSVDDVAEVGERFLPNAMPCDSVSPANNFEELQLNRVKPYLAELEARSQQRLEKDQDYSYIRTDIAEFRKEQADKSLSLNEAQRRAEQKVQSTRLDARKKERLARKKSQEKPYEITLKNVDLPELQPPPVKTNSVVMVKESDLDEDTDEAAAEGPAVDPPLDEAKRILADYVELLKKGPAISKTP